MLLSALSSFKFKRAYVTKNVPLEGLAVDPDGVAEEGDLVLVRVAQLKRQCRLETPEGRRAFLYSDDLIVGVIGKRYSTRHFSGFELPGRDAHLLTTSGIIGYANLKADTIKPPSDVEILGVLVRASGERVNLRDHRVLPSRPPSIGRALPVLLVVGSDMDSGKTTLASSLTKGLSNSGLKVYAFKLTGSASGPDYWKMGDAGATHTSDFLDAGWVSTCGLNSAILLNILGDALADAGAKGCDLVVIEVADGVLQSETAKLLESGVLKKVVSGVLVAGESAVSAVYAAEKIADSGYTVAAVGGLFTQYPLAIGEFSALCSYPVVRPDVLEEGGGAEMILTSLNCRLSDLTGRKHHLV